VVLFWGSKVKVTWSIALHNNTSFRTTIAFFSHLLGGDTSTIMLQLHFIVNRYSLDGDTDNSNTAWVHILVNYPLTLTENSSDISDFNVFVHHGWKIVP